MENFKPISNSDKAIFITQLIYVIPGKKTTFLEFEEVAIPIIAKYNGRLLIRTRPSNDTLIEHDIEAPYEIHLVEFESEQDFKNYMMDEVRKQFLHLKEASNRASILFMGQKL